MEMAGRTRGALTDEVLSGRMGKTAYERMKGEKAKVQGMEFGEAVLWKRRREGGLLGKLTCMW